MKEHPILFNGEMVQAIPDGRKTQTRRVIKPQPPGIEQIKRMSGCHYGWMQAKQNPYIWIADGTVRAVRAVKDAMFLTGTDVYPHLKCPYAAGDRLWVREAFHLSLSVDEGTKIFYRADGDSEYLKWSPSIHMPRWASRITLEVEDVEAEMLQDITDTDIVAEGGSGKMGGGKDDQLLWFQRLWDSLNKKYPWKSNPWVWKTVFRRAE